MKLQGILGTGTGKLGSSVFSTIGGKQVVRQYQPVVANPSTPAQVNQRARLKLASQLAASLAPVIAIPKEGLKTSRNRFIQHNMGQIIAANGTAQVIYENIQLTNGHAGLPAITGSRDAQNKLSLKLAAAPDNAMSRVAFVIYRKSSEGSLELMTSKIVDNAGEDYKFGTEISNAEGELVIFSYGMKDVDAKATAKYGNLAIENASDIARLVATRTISASEFQFTRTRGATLGETASAITPTVSGTARVYVTATSGGTATGAGSFDIGSQVTVRATPAANHTFVGWKKLVNGRYVTVSYEEEYSFTLTGSVDLLAEFESDDYNPGTGGGGEGGYE